MANWFADAVDNLGTAWNLPEIGLSELWNGGKKTTNTGRVAYDKTASQLASAVPIAGNIVGGPEASRDLAFKSATFSAPSTGGTTSGGGESGQVAGGSTSALVDPAAAAAQAQAAANAAKAGKLRGEITGIANTIKDIFNARYGQVDASGQEQAGKLNSRFGTESQDITDQVARENEAIGAAHSASGTFDSSYRGNNVDTVTKEGSAQIEGLNQELIDNLGKIAQWVSQQKASFDANKSGIDQILGRLGEETDVNNLAQIRNTLEGRIADLRSSSADNNTAAQNKGALETIAPSSARAQQLKTTLSTILTGNTSPQQKSAIAQKLVNSAGIDPSDAEKLLSGFQADLDQVDQTEQKPQV